MTAVDISSGCLVPVLPFSGNSIRFSSEELPCPFSGYKIQMALKSPHTHTASSSIDTSEPPNSESG